MLHCMLQLLRNFCQASDSSTADEVEFYFSSSLVGGNDCTQEWRREHDLDRSLPWPITKESFVPFTYIQTINFQLSVKLHTHVVAQLLPLTASCAYAHTPTHSHLCSLRQPGLPAEDSDGLSWTSAIHIPPSPGCHWFIWAQPVHSVTP